MHVYFVAAAGRVPELSWFTDTVPYSTISFNVNSGTKKNNNKNNNKSKTWGGISVKYQV